MQAGNKVAPSSSVTLASYVTNASAGSSMSGIPYCWGGMQGNQNLGSEINYTKFKTVIATSYGSNLYSAGNVNCTGNYKSGTAGVDCSGFVGCAFELTSKKNSEWFRDSFGSIVEGENYQSMDVMAKSGHVMLFDLYSASTD